MAASATSLSEHWKQVRDAASETSKSSLSDQTSDPASTPSTSITVDMLAGSYFAVWDSHTMIEPTDEPEQEISYLHLSLNNATAGSQATFADLQGRFRWWRKIGRLKDFTGQMTRLKRVPLSDDEDDEDQEEGELEHADEDEDDSKERSNHGFGIAAMVSLEDSGRPFLKMLYNKALPSDKPEYVHIVWKKQEKAGERDPLVLSDEEALRLAIYDGVQYEDRDPEVEAWKRVRDAAVKQGTVISKAPAQSVTPGSLLGSYGVVWDSYTMLEMLDDMGEEYSWLDLTVPEAQSGSVKFEDIQGSFRWWNMIGSFKGLFKVKNAEDNIWAFHGVTWRDEDEEEIETEDVSADRDSEYFGLAALPVLDKRRKPFIELLYNCTRFTEQEKRKTGTTEELGMGPVNVTGLTAIPPPKDYVRILCKKYKGEKTGLTMMLSGPEGTRLMRNANIDLSETRGSPSDEDNGEDEEHGSGEEERHESDEDEDEDEDDDADADGSPVIDEDIQQDMDADEVVKTEVDDFGGVRPYPRKRSAESKISNTGGTLKKVKIEA